MTPFQLDPRLADDCFIMSESKQFIVLLMNNALIPWFIVVPKTDKTELHELDSTTQTQIFSIINRLSAFISSDYKPDKINVAAIGNIVQQLHIHIVVRYKTDCYWPGVVWGGTEKEAYKEKKIENIKLKLETILEL